MTDWLTSPHKSAWGYAITNRRKQATPLWEFWLSVRLANEALESWPCHLVKWIKYTTALWYWSSVPVDYCRSHFSSKGLLFMENYNWSECREQVTVERPTLNGRSTTQSLRQGAGTRHQGDTLITPVCLFNLYWPPAQKVSLISKTSILWSRNIAHLNTSILVNQVTDMRSTHQTHIDVHLHF